MVSGYVISAQLFDRLPNHYDRRQYHSPATRLSDISGNVQFQRNCRGRRPPQRDGQTNECITRLGSFIAIHY